MGNTATAIKSPQTEDNAHVIIRGSQIIINSPNIKSVTATDLAGKIIGHSNSPEIKLEVPTSKIVILRITTQEGDCYTAKIKAQ